MATPDYYLDGSFGIIKSNSNDGSTSDVEIITGSISGVVGSYSSKILDINFSNLENEADIIFEEGTIITVTFSASPTEIEGILRLEFSNDAKFKKQDGTIVEDIHSFSVINGEGVYRYNSNGGEVDALQFVIISDTQAAVIDTYYHFETKTTTNPGGLPHNRSEFNKVTKVILNEATVGGSGNKIASHKEKTGMKVGSHYRDSASSSDFQTYSTGLADRDGYFPVGVVGWNSNSRFYRLLSAKLTNIHVLSETDGSNGYVGWAADLYWKIHNPSTTNSTATLEVYILWLKL